MQEAIFKVNTVKEVAKIYIKIMVTIWSLWQRHKTKVTKGIKHVKRRCSKLLFKNITNQQQWHLKYNLGTNAIKHVKNTVKWCNYRYCINITKSLTVNPKNKHCIVQTLQFNAMKNHKNSNSKT